MKRRRSVMPIREEIIMLTPRIPTNNRWLLLSLHLSQWYKISLISLVNNSERLWPLKRGERIKKERERE
ncbi:hypothetical protein TCSYLVIO_002987, partial [Trypanosoma cruzi]